jgi:uncharacterized membrane protein YidH (DUF202 family)
VAVAQERGDQFARDMASMRIADPSPGRHDLWLRVGIALMVGGLCLTAFGYVRAQGTGEALVQRDALALGMAGICCAIVGAAVYLRYSVTKVLRFWLARVSFDLQARSENLEDPR